MGVKEFVTNKKLKIEKELITEEKFRTKKELKIKDWKSPKYLQKKYKKSVIKQILKLLKDFILKKMA